MKESRKKLWEENLGSVTVTKHMIQDKLMLRIEFKLGNETMEEK